jgi:hypothetical protein
MAEKNVRQQLADAQKTLNNLKFEANQLQGDVDTAEARMGFEKGKIDAAVRDGKKNTAGYRNLVRAYNEAKARRDAAQAKIDSMQVAIGQADNQVRALAGQIEAETKASQEALKKRKAEDKEQREAERLRQEADALREKAAVERDLGNTDSARQYETQAAAKVREATAKAAYTVPTTAAGPTTVTAADRRRGADVTPATTAAPRATGATTTPTTTAAVTTTTSTGTTTKTSAGTKTTPATKTPSRTTDATTLTEAQRATLGSYGSKYLIDYFKNTPKYKYIYDYLVTAAKGRYEAGRVEAWLKDQNWYKDVNERVKAPIYASGLSNGITLSDAELNDFRDQKLAGLLSTEEIDYRLGQRAIEKFNLKTKPEIAREITAGKSFEEAVADYADVYRRDYGLSAAQFNVGDSQFLGLLNTSTSLDDFEKKLRRTDKFLSKQETQLAINANVSALKRKYARFGMKISDQDAYNVSKNIYLGDTTDSAVDDNLRKIAADTFQPFRDRILNGEDPLSIATPYISAMSRILEVPDGALDLEDPTVRKAMMGRSVTKGETTSHAATPLWEFEQQLYRDNRWQYTSNARSTLDQVSLDVLSRFGMIG